MIFRQLFEKESSTYTYILGDEATKEAVIIDPVIETAERDIKLLQELGLTLKYDLNTHVHADHITASAILRERTGCKSILAEASGGKAGIYVKQGDKIEFGKRFLTVRSTPGHTNGCVTYVLDDESMAFTGDALLIRGCGRTDFQQGSSETLYNSIHEQVFTLPDSCLLYPGHDYQGRLVTSVAEEKQYNPRLTKTKEGFVKFMSELGLPMPKKIKESLPANLNGGVITA